MIEIRDIMNILKPLNRQPPTKQAPRDYYSFPTVESPNFGTNNVHVYFHK